MKNHSANAHQQVIWLRGISNAGGSRWVERRVEFMILEFIGKVLKAMVLVILERLFKNNHNINIQ